MLRLLKVSIDNFLKLEYDACQSLVIIRFSVCKMHVVYLNRSIDMGQGDTGDLPLV